MSNDEDVYVCERVRAGLARDPRVADLGLDVQVAGGRLHLIGTVATEERRRAAVEVAAAVAVDLDVVDSVAVAPIAGPTDAEHLA
ncbi:MAG TPA: BON domain-containing protein [Acidimicrobiales bacterium]|nr:BON domain-containing protein [Acidimicrobiales bacterium]